jgi:hypothetical protein
MRTRHVLFLLSAGLPFGLGSCGLLRLPVRVAGSVVEGTAEAGRMMGSAAARPFTRTPEEKAAAAKKKAAEDEEKLQEKRAKLREGTDRHAADRQKAASELELPAEGSPDPANPPVPDDYLDIPADPDALPPPPVDY